MGNWYRVVKTIKGHRYLYEQRTWREGKHVRTQSRFIGRAGDTGSGSSSGQAAQAELSAVVNAAEFITKTLGLEIERLADTRRKGAKLIKYGSGRVTIGLSRDMRLDDPETQSSLWHEVGHYIDDPRTLGGRSQMSAKFTFGKVSTPNREIIRQHKEYILKERKPITLNYRFRFGGKIYHNPQDIISDSSFSGQIRQRVLAVVKRGEERIRDYISQDIELFAEGFARYVTNRDKVRRDAPLLAKVYDELFDMRPELKAIFGDAQQPIGEAQDG